MKCEWRQPQLRFVLHYYIILMPRVSASLQLVIIRTILQYRIKVSMYVTLNRCSCRYVPGLTRLWHACRKWHAESLPCHAAFPAVITSFCFAQPASVYCKECVYIHTYLTAYKLYMVYHYYQKHCSETFLHKSGEVRSVDWIFSIGASAWPWLGGYVTLDKIISVHVPWIFFYYFVK